MYERRIGAARRGSIRSLQLCVWLFLSGLRSAAQPCPPINFRTASQVTVANRTTKTASGLARQPNGSFTLHTYSYSFGITPTVQLLSQTPDYQQNFLTCSGHSPQPVIPPANWSFLGDPLLGTMSRNPIAVGLPAGRTGIGACLQICGKSGAMQTGVATSGDPTSLPSYTVSQNAYLMLSADLNNDGLDDVIVLNSDTPATLSVYLTQANGTLATPATVPVSSGGDLSATAMDFNGDGKIDLAIATDSLSTITVLLGKGDGSFRAPITVNTASYPVYLAAADFNGDGKPDLAAATSTGIAVHFGNGDGTFQSAQMVSTPSNVYGVAAGDLNNDGKPDLVASLANQGLVVVALNAGNGTFPHLASYATGYFGDIVELLIMDFDWDGNPDIVFAAGHPDALSPQAYSPDITVLFGNGDGTFNGIPAYPTTGGGFTGSGLAIADFNGDGKPDAIAAATLLIGHGDGTFIPQTAASLTGVNSVSAGDFNHDGKMDFAATTFDTISVFLGNGNGTFQAGASIQATTFSPLSVVTGDFNADGKLDLAVVGSPDGGSASNAYLYLGNGDGTFQAPRTSAVGSYAQNLQVADVNGDGKLDLVVTNNGTNAPQTTDPGNVMVLLGNGDGTFQQPATYAAGTNPTFTLVADVNGDSKPDLISTTTLDAANFVWGISVRLNQGNGTFGTPQTITSDFGPEEVAAADLNKDGKVDLLLAHCCGDTSLGYYLGNGNGTFQPEAFIVSGSGEYNLRVADLNGDGKPDALFTLQGPYAAAMLNISGIGPATTPITIQTSPTGLQFSVDGTTYTAPQTINLTQASHTIAVASPQAGATGTRYAFASWSDSGAASHSITVGSSPATYTASFTTQYLLTTAVSPSGAGTIISNPSGTYFNAGASVQLSASANSGYQFSNWSGDLSGSANPQSIAINGPHTVTANFSAVNTSCSLALGPPASLPPTGTSTPETCPNNSGQPSCGVQPETARSFSVTPSAGCGAWTATSSNPEFLQITSGASGSGAGDISYTLLTNTHNSAQNDSITVSSGAASATYSITEAGNADSEVYRQVYALYEQLLGRDPDAAGFAFWSGSGGAGLGQMADSFLTSPEAFNSDFAVMAAYQAATGNPPTFAQYTAAVASIRAGTQTVPGLFSALTGSGYSASNLYQNLLSRAPGFGDSNCIATGLAACFQTIIGYPSSTTPVGDANNEFQSTGSFHTNHSNALYVRMVYYVTVSRDPDADGFAFWLGVANNGAAGLLFQGQTGYPARIQILGPGTPNQGFIGSPEFQGLFAN